MMWRLMAAKRSPFLGPSWSAVRCRTCQRGAAGISVLQCTVGVDGTVEVVGTSGDEQLILRCKTYNEWHAVLSPSESESYRSSLPVNGGREKLPIDWRIVSISCCCGICSVVICWIICGDWFSIVWLIDCRRRRQLSIEGNCVDTASNGIFWRFWSYICIWMRRLHHLDYLLGIIGCTDHVGYR
jgi:hypothetical protein